MTTYPNQGPALEITHLPEDNEHMAAESGSCGSSRLRMAVGDLVADDAYPALRATRECDGGVLICRDDEHLEAVLDELREIGARCELLGEMRLQRVHDGDMAVPV